MLNRSWKRTETFSVKMAPKTASSKPFFQNKHLFWKENETDKQQFGKYNWNSSHVQPIKRPTENTQSEFDPSKNFP